MAYPTNPSITQLCSAPSSTDPRPPHLLPQAHSSVTTPTSAARCTPPSPVPFPVGLNVRAGPWPPPQAPRLLAPEAKGPPALRQPHSLRDSTSWQQTNTKVPFPCAAAAAAAARPPTPTPETVLSRLWKPGLAQHMSLLSFIVSELARGPSLLGSASSQLPRPTH